MLHFCIRSLGISSTTFKQCAPKATEFAEITQNSGHYAVQCHSRSLILIPLESSCDFQWLGLILIYLLSCTVSTFWDIAFDRSNIAVFDYPCYGVVFICPPTEGFLCDDLRKLFFGCQRMTNVPKAVEILPKISTACVGARGYRQTNDRQTNGRQHSEREREFTFAKIVRWFGVITGRSIWSKSRAN